MQLAQRESGATLDLLRVPTGKVTQKRVTEEQEHWVQQEDRSGNRTNRSLMLSEGCKKCTPHLHVYL